MSLDLAAKVFLLPGLQIAIVLVKYDLQPCRIKSCRLPQLSAGGLDEGIGVERVALWVLRRLNIETESRANKRPAGFGIGISRQHPAFMPAVAKDVHQAFEFELDVGIPEVKQRERWIQDFQRQLFRRKGSRWRWGPLHLRRLLPSLIWGFLVHSVSAVACRR